MLNEALMKKLTYLWHMVTQYNYGYAVAMLKQSLKRYLQSFFSHFFKNTKYKMSDSTDKV